MTTYRINRKSEEPVSITCLICERTSYSPSDVHELYCGNCHIFHENPFERRLLWPRDNEHYVTLSKRQYNRLELVIIGTMLILVMIISRLAFTGGF